MKYRNFFRNLLKRSTLVIFCCAIVGCSSFVRELFPGPERSVKIYDLRLGGKQCPEPAQDVEIKVTATLPSLVSQRFLYRPSADELAYYRFSTWSDPPALMIEPRLQREIGCQLSPTEGVFVLNCDLQRFDHDATKEPGSALIELDCTLSDRTSRAVLTSFSKSVRTPVASYDAQGAVQGIDAGLSIMATEIASKVREALQREASRGSVHREKSEVVEGTTAGE